MEALVQLQVAKAQLLLLLDSKCRKDSAVKKYLRWDMAMLASLALPLALTTHGKAKTLEPLPPLLKNLIKRRRR